MFALALLLSASGIACGGDAASGDKTSVDAMDGAEDAALDAAVDATDAQPNDSASPDGSDDVEQDGAGASCELHDHSATPELGQGRLAMLDDGRWIWNASKVNEGVELRVGALDSSETGALWYQTAPPLAPAGWTPGGPPYIRCYEPHVVGNTAAVACDSGVVMARESTVTFLDAGWALEQTPNLTFDQVLFGGGDRYYALARKGGGPCANVVAPISLIEVDPSTGGVEPIAELPMLASSTSCTAPDELGVVVRGETAFVYGSTYLDWPHMRVMACFVNLTTQATWCDDGLFADDGVPTTALAAVLIDDDRALLIGTQEAGVTLGDSAPAMATLLHRQQGAIGERSLGEVLANGADAAGAVAESGESVVYMAQSDGDYRWRLWRMTPAGAVHWSREVSLDLPAFSIYADDSRILVGVSSKGHAHLSPWGHETCEEAGVCGTMKWSDCDDGNPCTKNLCEPDTGCANPSFGDGTPCGYADGAVRTCVGGVCQL